MTGAIMNTDVVNPHVGLNRRRLLALSATAAAAAAVAPAGFAEDEADVLVGPRVSAIAFDGFVIFDPRPIFALAVELFPDRGDALGNLWRTRQFEYCWLRTLTGRYADFWTVTEQALVYAAAALKLDLTGEKRDQLMQAYLSLKSYPDVLPGLTALRSAGIRLGFISNLTEAMQRAAIASAGLDGFFEQTLSTDRVRAYKPDPRAYQMGMAGFGLPREEIVFAAFGGWDANGAKSFGYRTYWANRLGLPVETLDAKPDAVGQGVAELTRLVLRTK